MFDIKNTKALVVGSGDGRVSEMLSALGLPVANVTGVLISASVNHATVTCVFEDESAKYYNLTTDDGGSAPEELLKMFSIDTENLIFFEAAFTAKRLGEINLHYHLCKSDNVYVPMKLKASLIEGAE